MNGLLAGLAVLAGAGIAVILSLWMGGFWKRAPRPDHAVLVAKPGVTLDLTNGTGTVVAKVILDTITVDHREGTTVMFVDYIKYMERNTYHG